MYTISCFVPGKPVRLVRCNDGIYEVTDEAVQEIRRTLTAKCGHFPDQPIILAFDIEGRAYLTVHPKEGQGIVSVEVTAGLEVAGKTLIILRHTA